MYQCWVHTLNLSNCKSIVDVSMLGNVHILALNCNDNIVDVSSFSKVHTLYLCSVHTLRLIGCTGIL